MATSLTATTTLASLAAGNQPVSLIDGDLSQLYAGLNSLMSYGNYYLDLGSVNAVACTASSPQILTSLAAGLPLQIKLAQTNTGPATLNVTSPSGTFGPKAILNQDGSDLMFGDMLQNAIHEFMYDGTSFYLLNPSPKRQLAYTEFTAPVSITATSEATADTIVTASAVNFNGSTRINIEFFAPSATTGNPGAIDFVLYDGSASIGILGGFSAGSAITIPIYINQNLVPSNAVHTYSMRAFRSTNNGTVNAGAGGIGNVCPGYIQFTKV